MAIWVIKHGQREGPYAEQDVRELLFEGTYSDTDPAIREGQFDWTTLGLLLGRSSPAGSPQPSRPEPAPPELPQEPFSPYDAPGPEETGAAEAPPIEPPPVPVTFDVFAPELPGQAGRPAPIPVAVVDFEMPFGSMVVLMLKWALASIPAVLILGIAAAMFWTTFLAIVAALLRH